jgi:hypothetical protein
MTVPLPKPRVRYVVEAMMMLGLACATYFSVTTLNALPRLDASLTGPTSPRSSVLKRAGKAGPPAAPSAQRATHASVVAGMAIQCGARDAACDVSLTDVSLAEARPESVRRMLAALATTRCKDTDFRGNVDTGFGQFHRLYSNDDRYLGVIYVDREICGRSPISPDDTAVWPAPGVSAALALQGSGERKAARTASSDTVATRDAGSERHAADPGARAPRSVSEQPRPAPCVAKPVMTDAELARCRTG